MRGARIRGSNDAPSRPWLSRLSVVRGGRALALFVLVPHVEDADEVLGAGQSLPPFREEILRDDLLVGKVENRYTPLVEGVLDLDGVVALVIEIAHIALFVASPTSVDCHGFKYIPKIKLRGTLAARANSILASGPDSAGGRWMVRRAVQQQTQVTLDLVRKLRPAPSQGDRSLQPSRHGASIEVVAGARKGHHLLVPEQVLDAIGHLDLASSAPLR